MTIITDECLACASVNECGTVVEKGSIKCTINRVNNRQTKGEMIQKMLEIAKIVSDN